jgi:dihydropteroate synthase
MKIGNRLFDLKNQTYIMGILNLTPDSFSDGGKWNRVDKALNQVKKMIEEGCDIIDIGGESTRPGYTKISDSEELDRIIPVIQAIKKEFDIPISVDTYKSKVAKVVIEEGCDLINDIWGLKYDSDMAKVIKESGVACCLMHNRNTAEYHCFMDDMKNDLKETIRIALENGIDKNKIILDPGIGFSKSYQENLEIIAKLESLHELGYPLLLGTSRKSVIGLTLDLPVEERIEGTLVTSVLATMSGCGFVRVHDIKENKRVIKMTTAIKKYK